jgi:hypothetical protein
MNPPSIPQIKLCAMIHDYSLSPKIFSEDYGLCEKKKQHMLRSINIGNKRKRKRKNKET